MASDDPAETIARARLDAVRRELSILARRHSAHVTHFDPDRPCRWAPGTVKSACEDMCFTEAGAWEFIAQCLDNGVPLEEIALRKPPGKRGYVMKARVRQDDDLIYIKLQLGAGKIIGRSFHYSQRYYDDD